MTEEPHSAPSSDWLSTLSDGQFRIVTGLIGVALFALLFQLRFCRTLTLPIAPPKPVESVSLAEAEASVRRFEQDARVYSKSLVDDSVLVTDDYRLALMKFTL